MFEFAVFCRTYDYTSDDQKLKLFPSTLKDETLCWFMGPPGDSITTWAQMEETFSSKYRDYCKSKETKNEIFRMTLGPDEYLEDYEERFQLNYKRTNYTLVPASLKIVLIRGISEEMIETLNMLSGEDI